MLIRIFKHKSKMSTVKILNNILLSKILNYAKMKNKRAKAK